LTIILFQFIERYLWKLTFFICLLCILVWNKRYAAILSLLLSFNYIAANWHDKKLQKYLLWCGCFLLMV
jgi:hypothetical protein